MKLGTNRGVVAVVLGRQEWIMKNADGDLLRRYQKECSHDVSSTCSVRQ